MKTQEFSKLVNTTLGIYSLYDVDRLISENGVTAKRIASAIDSERHKWYMTAVNVYQCEDGFVSVRGVYQNPGAHYSIEGVIVQRCKATAYIEENTNN